jgi:enoyl-CoA hydratase
MTRSDKVLARKEGHVGHIIFNNPARHNAVSLEMWQTVSSILEEFSGDAEVRTVVLSGAGDKAFVAGADIAEFEGRTPVDQWRTMKAPTIFDAVERCPKPVIAAVNGFCLGGGMELALACDIRIASSAARFGQPEVNLGIIPGGGGTQRLPRVVGLGGALRLILSGDLIDANEALRLRLVEEVVEPAQLLDRALALAESIASKSPVAVAAAKEATRAALSLPLERGLELETALFQLCFASEDKVEGVRAFLEKRAANFSGR